MAAGSSFDGDIRPVPAITETLVDAIQRHRTVRLAYRRQRDEVTTVHQVAPVDIRPGATDTTSGRLYLWAYCYAEAKLERHLLDRVVMVEDAGQAFLPHEVLSLWPKGWQIPSEWVVPRLNPESWGVDASLKPEG